MFGLFKTEHFQHPTLGGFQWAKGYWRGKLSVVGGGVVPLIVEGTRKGPDQEALVMALSLGRDLQSIEPKLKQELFEHYEPYGEASAVSQVRSADHALNLAEVEAVVVAKLDGELATEVCYRVPWDAEHTLGARFRGSKWVELCGSTLVP